jgi:hypothetical protein
LWITAFTTQFQIIKRSSGELPRALHQGESQFFKHLRQCTKKTWQETASNQILTAFWQNKGVCGAVVVPCGKLTKVSKQQGSVECG